AAADDEDALVAQGRERAADRQMRGRVELALQRELHGGHVRRRIGELERDEGAVVETAALVRSGLEPGAAKKLANARCELRIARRRPLDLVRFRREAVVVVEHRRA